MFETTSTPRLLQSATACLLAIAGLAAPARSGDGADRAAPVPDEAPARVRAVGALATGQWNAEPLREALEGAAERLSDPACAAVLEDFTDPLGRPLREQLDRLGLTPSDWARTVLFYRGFDEDACRRNRRAFAFTAPGRQVVRVCRPLATLAGSRPEDAQAVVIHEVLHTLGLGENPPSSAAITAQVKRRCFSEAGSADPLRQPRTAG